MLDLITRLTGSMCKYIKQPPSPESGCNLLTILYDKLKFFFTAPRAQQKYTVTLCCIVKNGMFRAAMGTTYPFAFRSKLFH